MISVVCWMWHDALMAPVTVTVPKPPEIRMDMRPRRARGDRTRYVRPPKAPPTQVQPKPREFLPAHVNTLQRMFARHLPEKHRFICITDDDKGLDSAVEWVPTPRAAREVAELRSPEGARFPSCYRRLWSFSEDAKLLGDRLFIIDIDLVVTRDMTPVLAPTQEFVGWRPFRDWGKRLRFGGGSYLMTAGSRRDVWDSFRGQASIDEARAAGFRGSDQAWISYKLAEKEVYWPKESGLYSVRDLGPGMPLPRDARLVQFNGHMKPWHYRTGWVTEHWR